MTGLRGRVREQLRTAADTSDAAQLLLPQLLGAPDTWRLTTSMR